MTPALAAALKCLSSGRSVVPLRRQSKVPYVAWAPFQNKRPSRSEIETWYRRWPGAGLAVVCGQISGVAVLDVDPRNGTDGELVMNALEAPAPTVITGRGRHLYFRIADPVPRICNLLPGVDLLGERSLATQPPSVHANGREYQWEPGLGVDDIPMPWLPVWILARARDHERERLQHERAAWRGPAPPELEAVLGRLKKVRRIRSGWVGCCPVPGHDDTEPSLSVGVGRDGRLLLHCFGGCRFSEIVTALKAAA